MLVSTQTGFNSEVHHPQQSPNSQMTFVLR